MRGRPIKRTLRLTNIKSDGFNPGSALTPSHDDPLEDSVLIRLTETAPARVASTSALEPPLRTGKSSAAC